MLSGSQRYEETRVATYYLEMQRRGRLSSEGNHFQDRSAPDSSTGCSSGSSSVQTGFRYRCQLFVGFFFFIERLRKQRDAVIAADLFRVAELFRL
jgi:hypothetical protein